MRLVRPLDASASPHVYSHRFHVAHFLASLFPGSPLRAGWPCRLDHYQYNTVSPARHTTVPTLLGVCSECVRSSSNSDGWVVWRKASGSDFSLR